MRAMVLLAVAAFAGSAAAADVYKCPRADGKVEYQDRPCPGAAGTKVTIKADAVAEVDQSAIRAKSEALDKKTNARLAAEKAENDRRAAYQQARLNECQGYIDAATRQEAWLSSISAAVRQSAANEIAIQANRYEASDCRRVMR